MSKKKIVYFIISCALIIGLFFVAQSVFTDIVAKNNELKLSQAKIETREVKLDGENCKYSLNEESLKITIERYKGVEDCIVIPKEINGQQIEKINSDAFKDCYNLETIQIAKELSDVVQGIEDFEINEQFESQEYIEYKTTRSYSEAYKGYLDLSAKERAAQEVIPDKFSVPVERLYSEDMEQTYGISTLEEAGMPASYDLRDYIDIKVENQGSYGICYAYSALSTIETNLSLRKNETVDLSEIHYSVTSGQGYGGWFITANDKYYSSKIGPVYELDWAKSDIDNTNEINKIINKYLSSSNADISKEDLQKVQEEMKKTKAVKYVRETVDLPSISKSMKEDETKKEEVQKIRDTIKKHIMEYGSLDAYISMDDYNFYGSNMVMNYQGAVNSAHGVNIIGWDDNFSKNNFPSNSRPKNDGAYLVLNSWGDYWGNEGYFWISYEDRWVESNLNGTISVEEIGENIICNAMSIRDIDTNEVLNNAHIGKGQNIEISLDFKVNNIFENGVDVKIRNKTELFTKDIVISGQNIVNNNVNLKINMNTREYQKGVYIIEINYGGETISKQIEIISNTFDYTINKDGESITITKYNGEDKDIEIPKEYAGYKVTAIANNAFRYNNIENITVYENIEKIGTTIIPNGVIIYGYEGTPIETYAKKNNYTFFLIGQEIVSGNYWKYDIKNKILYITGDMEEKQSASEVPWYNFSRNVYEIKFETDKISAITDYAFYNCTNIESIEIPENATKIGKYAFYNCSILKKAELHNKIEYIGEYAFYHCTNLENIEIPDKVTKINEKTFTNCKKLTEIILKDGITEIGSQAFYYCENLEKIEIPQSVTDIDEFAFACCYKLQSINLPNNLKRISTSMLGSCSSLKSVKIPNSVEKIEVNAFRGSDGIEKIEMPENVTSIGERAFQGCSSLQEIVMPETVKEIGAYLFYDCINLKTVNLKSRITNISSLMFKNCKMLKEINLPDTITTIGTSAFEDCESLETIEMPKSVEKIQASAFAGCTKLINIKLPEKISVIEKNTFNNCTSLKDVNILPNIEKISEGAFKNCKAFESINIPDTVKEVGSEAFSGCPNLKSINIPSSLTIGTDVFSGSALNVTVKFEVGQNEKEVEMPNILKRIINPGDILYSSEGFTLNGCQVNGNIIKINSSNLSNKRATITVNNGKMTGFIVKVIGEFETLDRIEIKNPPNKTVYKEGEKFDPEGMVVEAIYNGGTRIIVTDYYIPYGNKLTLGQTSVIVRYKDKNTIKDVLQPITVEKAENNQGSTNSQIIYTDLDAIEGSSTSLANIKITTKPNKIDYIEGEKFDKTGMVITANYSNGTSKKITSYTYTPKEELKVSDTKITISYTESGVTKKVDQKITVKSANEINNETDVEDNEEKSGNKGIVVVIVLVAVAAIGGLVYYYKKNNN